jgi:hypothetical protein
MRVSHYEVGSGFIQLQHKAQQKEMPSGISPSADFSVEQKKAYWF